MRALVRKAAHAFERIGLAMAGATCGLLVGAYVGSGIAALTSQGFLVIMTTGGAVGFYLGIDPPPQAFHGPNAVPGRRVDAAEFLSAVGTFLASLTAIASVSLIVFRWTPHTAWTILILCGWIVGLMMQIVSGVIARLRSSVEHSSASIARAANR
jgi:hypothetical protein